VKKLALFGAFPILVCAQTIAGDWHGWIEITNDAPLRLAMHIDENTPPRVTIDSMDEGVLGLPVDRAILSGPQVHFEIKAIAGIYEGDLAADGSRIQGSWRQDGGTWPLTWERGEDPAGRTQPLAESEAMKKGRLCAEQLNRGDLTALWAELGPVMRQSLRKQDGLRELRDETLRQSGSEARLISESLQTAGTLQVYRRVVSTAKGNIEIQFAFDPGGAAVDFQVGPIK
jgi:hypothetical protein